MITNMQEYISVHCVKSVRIWSYSVPHFPAFGLNTERYWTEYREILCISPYSVQMRENTDQNNSKYEHIYAVVCKSKDSFSY